MKVPNKILDVVQKLLANEPVSDDDRRLASAWVLEGKSKRAAMAAEQKLNSVAS